MTATALGLVNTLRAKTRTVDPSAIKDDDYGWGTFKVRHVSRAVLSEGSCWKPSLPTCSISTPLRVHASSTSLTSKMVLR